MRTNITSSVFGQISGTHIESHELSQEAIDFMDAQILANLDDIIVCPAGWVGDNFFFIKAVFELPTVGAFEVNSALYGPDAGDEPIYNDDPRLRSIHRPFGDKVRPGATLVLDRAEFPWRPASHMVVIGCVKIVDETVVIGAGVPYTAFGNSNERIPEKEPSDPNLAEHEVDASKAYWGHHKLSHVFVS